MIQGVTFKSLVTHADERGFFRELIRTTDGFFQPGFGQLSHAVSHTGALKAWHGHKVQMQWSYVLAGLMKVALYDTRPDSPTYKQTSEFLAGEGQAVAVYNLPPGVLHGHRCLSGPLHIIYVTSATYDPADEIRVPAQTAEIPYDWSSWPWQT